jgi:acetylornithine deacetylase/succinyl-diaminopimelate desuccinylase-like protein
MIIVLTQCIAISQVIYSSKVDSVVNLVSLQSVTKFVRELSGDTITNIGGIPYLIYSRSYYDTIPNQKAAQYIYEKFQSFGLQTRYQNSSNITNNVIAKKTGSKYPNRQYIICAHFDNYSTSPNDTIPGADDNASGVAAVLEAA